MQCPILHAKQDQVSPIGFSDAAKLSSRQAKRGPDSSVRLSVCRPLSAQDKGLLWRFRWSLKHDKRALTRFLKCVDWGDAHEARQAVDLMQHWAPIDTADALELLSPDFTNQEVCVCLSVYMSVCLSVWAPIDTADALELLSPDFTNQEVCVRACVCLSVCLSVLPAWLGPGKILSPGGVCVRVHA
jgi:Phosphoinositide 3-kinase family, accessory domain (PIK domain)